MPAAGRPRKNEPRRVLVVDDLTINRLLLVRWLGRNGFEAVEADSGERALEILADSRFDLVVLDVVMPGMNGFEVLRRIRRTHAADALPVFMATGKSEEREIALAAKLGANGYLIKPLDLPAALIRIKAALPKPAAARDTARRRRA
jgi:CheY-like chemotaxis protein